MSKYVTIRVGRIITRIAVETNIPSYTKGVIEPFFPTEDELNKWSDKQEREWIKANNKRMAAICDFLNKENL